MSLSSDLGEVKEVGLAQGTIRYRERGTGEPSFSSTICRSTVTCGARWSPSWPTTTAASPPDLPLGSHEISMKPDADLSIPGVASVLAEFERRSRKNRITEPKILNL